MATRVALFPTCIVDTLVPRVGVSAARVLRRLGYQVSLPKGITCCGQPAWNSGLPRQAARVAGTTLSALERSEADLICVLSGSCATMMRVYWQDLFSLVGDDKSADRAAHLSGRVREFSELIGSQSSLPGRYPAKVAYHHSCHMTRELGISAQPIALLDGLDGCERVEWSAAERCCGFGGMFAVKQPEISVAMADEKIDSLVASGAEEVVGCDQSCLLHLEGRLLRRGVPIRVRHLAEVLDKATDGGRP
jgi:L-lactate dehydrogenase complex protein LldE